MAVLIDTDVLIDWEWEETASALDRLVGSEDRAISVITVSELLHGVHRARGATRKRSSNPAAPGGRVVIIENGST